MDKHILCDNSNVKKIIALFPGNWQEGFSKIDLSKLTEIRIRVNQPITLKILNKSYYLAKNNISNEKDSAIIPQKNELEKLVFLLCNKSIYAYVQQLIKGFITFDGGIRVGVCGETVIENNEIISLKNFTSINIRIPHNALNCSIDLKKFFTNPLKNILIISKPGVGKTTFLRDMIYQLKSSLLNVLIIDEREEITGLKNSNASFLLNDSFDVISNCPKKQSIEWGIRSMSPDLIVCDELFAEDMPLIKLITNSGINVFATTHGNNLINAHNKLNLNQYDKIFDYFIVLNDKNGLGTIDNIFNIEKQSVL